MAHVIPTRVPREVVLFRKVAPSGGVASFDITGIPADCDVIKIYINGKTEKTAGTYGLVYIAFNADTTNTHYYRVRHYSSGVSSLSDKANDRFVGAIGTNYSGGLATGQTTISIIHPASAFHKSAHGTYDLKESASTIAVADIHVSWASTAAITQITLTTDSGDFAEGTLCLVTAIRNT